MLCKEISLGIPQLLVEGRPSPKGTHFVEKSCIISGGTVCCEMPRRIRPEEALRAILVTFTGVFLSNSIASGLVRRTGQGSCRASQMVIWQGTTPGGRSSRNWGERHFWVPLSQDRYEVLRFSGYLAVKLFCCSVLGHKEYGAWFAWKSGGHVASPRTAHTCPRFSLGAQEYFE
jgi:hypothetical protein